MTSDAWRTANLEVIANGNAWRVRWKRVKSTLMANPTIEIRQRLPVLVRNQDLSQRARVVVRDPEIRWPASQIAE